MNEQNASQTPGSPQKTTGTSGTPSTAPVQTTPEAEFEAGKSHARQAAEELRHAAALKAQQLRSQAESQVEHFRTSAEARAGQLRHAAEDTWSEARHRATDARSELERYVQEKPATALLTAFGVGVFLGLILRR